MPPSDRVKLLSSIDCLLLGTVVESLLESDTEDEDELDDDDLLTLSGVIKLHWFIYDVQHIPKTLGPCRFPEV